MATVYKRKDCNVYHYEFTDHEGKRRTATGFKDKAQTKRHADKVEQTHAMVRAGHLPLTAVYTDIPLEKHLAEFESHLRAKKVGEDQIQLKMSRLRTLLDKMGVEKLNDIDADDVSEALAALRTGTKKKKGISIQTSNHYLTGIKQFATWGRKNKRLMDDPLATLDKLNVETDRRHDRRALTEDEVTRLLTATMGNRVVLTFKARDRAALYVFGLYTGLRASELASLTPESIDLDASTVTVQAGYSKRRRLDLLPIPAAILGDIRAWLAGKEASKPLWPGDWAKHRYAGKMLQADLEAAGIPYQDARGLFADFHALRHTYITNLAVNDVPLATAQKLARHSTPMLTSKRYVHLDLQHQAKAADKLPALQCLLQWNGVSGRQKSSADGTADDGADGKENPTNPAEHAGKRPLRAIAPHRVCSVFKTGAIGRSATSPDVSWAWEE